MAGMTQARRGVLLRLFAQALLSLWFFDVAAQAPAPLDQPAAALVVGGNVNSIARQTDGSVIVGGTFSSINGVARRNIARIRADGSVDPVWNPSADAPVFALAVTADGGILAGGAFSTIGGKARLGIAKLSGSAAGDAESSWSAGAGGSVQSILVHSSGSVFVGGNFTTMLGAPRGRIAKLTAAGVVDMQWAPVANDFVRTLAEGPTGTLYVGGSFTTFGGAMRSRIARVSAGAGAAVVDPMWNPAANNNVHAIAVGPGGSIYAGGSFSSIGGQSRAGLAKLGDPNGQAVAGWDPQATGLPTIITNLGVDANDRLVVGGAYDAIGGQPRNNLARLLPSGTADPAWQASTNFGIESLGVDAAGTVYAGGRFTRVGGQLRLGLVRVNADATLAPRIDAETDGAVWTMTKQSSGATIIGGNFLRVGEYDRAYIARLLPDGNVDPDWNPSASSFVTALAVDASDDVYAGGYFSEIDEEPRMHIAKLSGTGAGAVDAAWIPDADGVVDTLAAGAGGEIFACGTFGNIGMQPRARLAKLLPSGAADPLWNPSPDGGVSALVPDGDSVYVGGTFANIGSAPRARIARLDAGGVGVADSGWNPGANGAVRALAVSDDAVYAAGSFSLIGGAGRQGLAKLAKNNNNAVPDWKPVPENAVTELATDAAGNLYIAGNFEAVDGKPRLGLAILSSAGGVGSWSPSVTGTGSVQALAIDTDTVTFGGDFDAVGGVTRLGLAAVPSAVLHSVPAFATGNGSVEPAFQRVPAGTSAVLFVAADAHNHLVGVSGDPCTLTAGAAGVWTTSVIEQVCHVDAVFARDSYAVSATVLGSGTIAPETQDVLHGDEGQITVSPAAGHRLATLTGDNCTPTSAGGATWNTGAIVAPCAIEAAFRRNPVALPATVELEEDAAVEAVLQSVNDGGVTFAIAVAPAKGSVELLDAATGAFRYTPAPDAAGGDAFGFEVSDDTVTSPTATQSVTILAVNDAPSLALGPARLHAPGASGPQRADDFAQVVVGPADEQLEQSIEAFLLSPIDDPDAVLVPASIAIDEEGNLTYELTGNPGTATVGVQVRDDGGTARGGVDTSPRLDFEISVVLSADLRVDVSTATPFALPGQPSLHDITIVNLGPVAVADAVVEDDAPAGLADGAWTCVPASSTTACPAAPWDMGEGALEVHVALPPGTQVAYTRVGRIAATPGERLTYEVTVASPAGPPDPVVANNTDSVDTFVGARQIFADGFDAVP